MVNKSGSALLSALFIMTLVAIAATAMSMRLQLDIHRTRLTLTSDRLYLASQGVTFWAMDFLSQKKITLSASEPPKFPDNRQSSYPGIVSTGYIFDLQARFNINNLLDKKYFATFDNLLNHLLPNLTSEERKVLVLATQSWIKTYEPDRGHDEYFSEYLKSKPPYLPAHLPMKSISELRLVKNMHAKTYQMLLPHVIALPESTPININTASKEILHILGNGLTSAQTDELIQARSPEPIKELKDINALLQKLNIPSEQLTIESNYFLCQAITSSDDLTLTNYTIIKRQKDKKGNVSVSIVLESLNTL